MGFSNFEILTILLAVLLPVVLVLGVPIFAIVYLFRRSEVGPELARREIKRSAIAALIMFPSVFIIAFAIGSLLINSDDLEGAVQNLVIFLTAVILFMVIYPPYWWWQFSAAKKSELFQVPVKGSRVVPFVAIAWVVLGIVRLALFFVRDDLVELVMGLLQIMLGFYFGAIWLRPTWHVTEEGIFYTLVTIKWKIIVDQEWQPKNEQEVLLRLFIKRWWFPIKIAMNQVIPIEYEQQLKAAIQKYSNMETPTSAQNNQSSGLTGG